MKITETIIRPHNNYDLYKVIVGKESAIFNTYEECKNFCKNHWQKQKDNNEFFFVFDEARIEGEYDFCRYELFATIKATDRKSVV